MPPVEEFYASRKRRYDAFLIPPRRTCVDDFYRTLGRMWQLPECSPPATVGILQAENGSTVLERMFLEESDRWERETAHLSSPLQRMTHPSYQAIMGMSASSPENKRTIIGLMLRDVRKNQREWFLALSYLTQHNPVKHKDYGKTSKMTESWVKWGESQGLL